MTLDRAQGAAPLYRQIQSGIRGAILNGILGEGMRLQPEREVAAMLGINRTTIMRAYQELADEGLVVARPGRGTLVAERRRDSEPTGAFRTNDENTPGWLLTLPSFGNGMLGPDPSLLRDIAELSALPDQISFSLGAPGPDLIPISALIMAANAELEHAGGSALGYGPVEGLPALRESISQHMSSRGVRVSPSEVMIVSGATQGLALAARALLEPGDEVVVEAPTYVGILQTFASTGARLVGVPVDRQGMRLDDLSSILARRRIRLIVVQPTLHNPTNASMPAENRARLIGLAERFGVPILEDDAYGELWRDGSGPLPLRAIDSRGNVIYLGTFSKTLAPALRIGWIVAPRAIIGRFTLAKQFADLQSGSLAQYAVQGFLTSGMYQLHLAHVRAAYNERRYAAINALRELSGVQTESGSDGGFYLWCRLPAGIGGRALAASAGRAGVSVLAGEAFYPRTSPGSRDGQSYFRLSYASQPPALIRKGVRRLAALLADQDVRTPPLAQSGIHPVI
jgi:DNA-binding transcriptional MocR family regulator